MDGVRSYLVSVVAVCMITVVADVLIRESVLKKILRLIGGILILLVAIRPLLSLDLKRIGAYLDEINANYQFDTDEIQRTQQDLLRQQVRQSAETYIENEAKSLGGTLQAEVTVSDEDYPVPVSVILIGSMTPEDANTVSEYIQTALGIPADRQEWRLYG